MSEESTGKQPRRVPAVMRALDILELVRDSDEPLSAAEITSRLGLPRTSIHELIGTLEARGFLSAEQPHLFHLGPAVLPLGHRYESRIDLARLTGRVARALSKRSRETVHVAVLEGPDILYLVKEDSDQAVRMVSQVGLRLPAHATAVGKMLLSQLSDEEVDALLPRDVALKGMTEHTITDHDRLRQELVEIRRRGTAMDDRESNLDVKCVAAPIRDRNGRAVAALSMSVPTSRITPEFESHWYSDVAAAADECSALLGAPEPTRGGAR